MDPHFYDLLKNHNKDELFKIVLSPDEYQPEAVIAAIKVITEKNWKEELDKRLEHEHQLKEQDIREKAEYFKNAVGFKSQRYSIIVNVSYIPQFESALNDNGIKFFREDQNVFAQLSGDGSPEYFFKLENKEMVDKIVKELRLY